MKEPKIRFKGFSGEWKECTLSNIITVNSGKDYKHLEKGTIPVYGTGGYMLSVNTSLSEHDAIGIGRKGTIDKPQYLKAPFWTVDTLFFLTTNNGDNLDFLFSLSQNIRWQKYDESTGVPSLSKNNIDKIKTCIPNKFEQQSVASFFTSLDAQISASTSRLASLKQVKAASLQAMFPQEGETVPKVRFKGFEGEWKKVKLSECLEISTERNLNNKYGVNEVLSVSDEEGVMNQIKLLGRSYAGKSVTNYKILRTNQVVYTKSPLKAKPYGIVKVNKGETGIVSVLYAVYDAKECVSPDYIHYYFEPTFRINNYLLPLINKGAKNTMNISDEVSLQGDIILPNTLEEQLRIVEYLQTLDAQIALHTKRLEKLKQIKAACLDKMFV
ncbi:restriction endonuclease subunit S [Prevotellamassilia timonensis]|uniref:restriction endonuclease subunit S n=1 Tax=Prevotellamassilia timonensis TaxID=1852370 RepID=UPI0023F2108B|nr:restriction endonuclease subunit S [Prevotellamassilia timonensis]MDD7439065.1 restriction endonuclease subunit S [Prevotellamassilia timonensis]